MSEKIVYAFAAHKVFHPAFFSTEDVGIAVATASLERKFNGTFCGNVTPYEIDLEELNLPPDVIESIYRTVQEMSNLNFTAIIPRIPIFLDCVEQYLLRVLQVDTGSQH